jgi:septum formation protein
MKKLILASTSPRRSELLEQLGLHFEVISVDIDETSESDESAQVFVQRMALEKAQAGAQALATASWVIGGDTLLSFEGEIFGKPPSYSDYVYMMRNLSGNWHEVLSAVALVGQQASMHKLNITRVKFMRMTEREIEHYWQSGEPIGKAGGYAIQGKGARYIERIDGSYSAVMGLPLFELNQLLTEGGFYNE